ncbi:hypothetical protein HY212_06825 [Candidatus Pacearchaeota archaeon]|nr:hypothetical protein [Candidatus Pacearchaeota archaeon]
MRVKRPDFKNAQSLVESSEDDIDFVLGLPVNEKSASTIVRNIYEAFRKLGDALLTSRGIKTLDHVEPIKALINLKINAKRPTGILDNLRQLRHNVNYYGYKPKIEEVKDSISIAKELFKPLLEIVKKEISQ